jgi:hypothetical protein
MQHLQWPQDSVVCFSATYESWVSASEEVSVGHANSACMQSSKNPEVARTAAMATPTAKTTACVVTDCTTRERSVNSRPITVHVLSRRDLDGEGARLPVPVVPPRMCAVPI